jgi:hypothetical protein
MKNYITSKADYKATTKEDFLHAMSITLQAHQIELHPHFGPDISIYSKRVVCDFFDYIKSMLIDGHTVKLDTKESYNNILHASKNAPFRHTEIVVVEGSWAKYFYKEVK